MQSIITSLYKKLVKKIHPDYFQHFPQAVSTNHQAMNEINAAIRSVSNGQRPETTEFKFYISPSDELISHRIIIKEGGTLGDRGFVASFADMVVRSGVELTEKEKKMVGQRLVRETQPFDLRNTANTTHKNPSIQEILQKNLRRKWLKGQKKYEVPRQLTHAETMEIQNFFANRPNITIDPSLNVQEKWLGMYSLYKQLRFYDTHGMFDNQLLVLGRSFHRSKEAIIIPFDFQDDEIVPFLFNHEMRT